MCTIRVPHCQLLVLSVGIRTFNLLKLMWFRVAPNSRAYPGKTLNFNNRSYGTHVTVAEVNIQVHCECVGTLEHALMFCQQQQLESTIVSTNNVLEE